jgi:hypothetical protein
MRKYQYHFPKYKQQHINVHFLTDYTVLFSVLKKAFDAFDREKNGCISTEMVGTILEMLGHRLDDDMLAEIIAEVDADGEYF